MRALCEQALIPKHDSAGVVDVNGFGFVRNMRIV
jgi:hypothetical protein